MSSAKCEQVDRFDQVVTRYWQALRPLYRKLHAYVRYKLRAYYPGRFGARDPIPVHLLGVPHSVQYGTAGGPVRGQLNGTIPTAVMCRRTVGTALEPDH